MAAWKPVERRATAADLVLWQQWKQKQTAAMIECRARAAELQLEGVKIVAAEYSFDGARLAFMFSTESEDKVDLKTLRKDMQRLYPESQVEMRQIESARCGETARRDVGLRPGNPLLFQNS